jgi:hypothetical protein
MKRRKGAWRSTSKSLPCIGCGKQVSNVGDHAAGVLCSKCTTTEEGWRRYEKWKAERRRSREPDELDMQIKDLKKAIKELEEEK